MQEKQHQQEQFKTEEGTGDLIGNKIADKKKSVSKKSAKELPNDETEEDEMKEIKA